VAISFDHGLVYFKLEHQADECCHVLSLNSNYYGFNIPYEFQITIAFKKAIECSLNSIQKGILILDVDKKNHYFNGILKSIKECEKLEEKFVYCIAFVSPLYLLVLSQNNRTYVNMTVLDIIRDNLKQFLPDYSYAFKLSKSYSKIPFLAQYNQTDFSFIMELLNDYQIWYSFEQSEGYQKIIFYDEVIKEGLDTSPIMALKFVDENGLTECEEHVFDLKVKRSLYASQEKIYIKTNVFSLSVGQKIQITQHPCAEFNQTYRIIRMKHDIDQSARKMRYANECELIGCNQTYVFQKKDRQSYPITVQAKIKSDSNYPLLDEQGRYYVDFYFEEERYHSHADFPIHRVAYYGGVKQDQAYGIHFPLNNHCEVAISFLENSIKKPIVLGALSHAINQNPVNNRNLSCNRIRTSGGNELILDDYPKQEKIILSTFQNRQRIELNANKTDPFVAIENNCGCVSVFAESNIESLCGQDFYVQVGKNSLERVGKQYLLMSSEAFLKFLSHNNISIESKNDAYLESKKADVQINASQYIKISSSNNTSITASNRFLIHADGFNFSTSQIDLFARGIVKINSAVNISSSQLNFSSLQCNANSITQYYPVSHATTSDHERVHQSIDSENNNKKRKQKIFPLIAFNFRDDLNNDYFKSEKIANDNYRRDKLTADELAYFVYHGNNVTIFIHGYHVPYGEFGKPLEIDGLERLKGTFFGRTDIYRDLILLEDNFPDAKIDGRLVNSSAHLVSNNDLPNRKLFYQAVSDPMSASESDLNGKGAHNWWLQMEWNINHATDDFDPKDSSQFARMLHVAWQGNPKSTLDYMAAVPEASKTAEKLIPVVDQLIKQGVEVNIVAHSLGNQVVLKLMDLLGKKSEKNKQYYECLNYVFLWQPAVPNNVFSRSSQQTSDVHDYYVPDGYKSVKKILILYSECDHILGPIPPKETLEFWRQAFDFNTGLGLACLVGTIYLLDSNLDNSPIQSPYHLANVFGKPLTLFIKNSLERNRFYSEWIKNHVEMKGNSKIEKFPALLKEQMHIIKLKYTRAYNYVSLLLRAGIGNTTQMLQLAKALWIGEGIQRLKDRFIPGITIWNKFLHKKSCYVDDPPANETAVLIITVLISKGSTVPNALGYSGPDTSDTFCNNLIKSGKLVSISQKDWLISHSSMRIPNAELMQKIYKEKIWQANKNYHFGMHQHKKEDGSEKK